jgi:hypothetical protein
MGHVQPTAYLWSTAGAGPAVRQENVMDNYEAPEIVEIGSLHELTLQDKDSGGNDGFTFLGQIIGNAS